jgi:hypothetical protein
LHDYGDFNGNTWWRCRDINFGASKHFLNG